MTIHMIHNMTYIYIYIYIINDDGDEHIDLLRDGTTESQSDMFKMRAHTAGSLAGPEL